MIVEEYFFLLIFLAGISGVLFNCVFICKLLSSVDGYMLLFTK